MRRAALGALAGLAATMAMTAFMQRAYARLPASERYPLPPRELTERIVDAPDLPTTTMLSHFSYGALAGALYGILPERPAGIVFGPLVWAASYLGWIPVSGRLRSAVDHPARRNALMLCAHLVWGAALSFGLKELERAADGAFADGPLRDSPRNSARDRC